MVTGDFKEYAEGGFSVGVQPGRGRHLVDLDEVKASILSSLEAVRRSATVLDAVAGDGHHARTQRPPVFALAGGGKELGYKCLEENVFDLPGVLSRKKQLLPEILRIIDRC